MKLRKLGRGTESRGRGNGEHVATEHFQADRMCWGAKVQKSAAPGLWLLIVSTFQISI